jgi:nucleoside-diphosphate-sugar epimerase
VWHSTLQTFIGTAARGWSHRPAVSVVFSPTLRAIREVAYQLEQPFVVDHSKFARAFGARPTPTDDAIRHTIAWYRDR